MGRQAPQTWRLLFVWRPWLFWILPVFQACPNVWVKEIWSLDALQVVSTEGVIFWVSGQDSITWDHPQTPTKFPQVAGLMPAMPPANFWSLPLS